MLNLKTSISGYTVSTVALPFAMGLDLYETIVFDKQDAEVDMFTRRYKTYDEAETGHHETADQVEYTVRERQQG